MNQQNGYIFYGSKTHAQEVARFIEHVVGVNMAGIKQGRKKKTVCIWGTHGIGKTELVSAVARDLNYEFRYIAPAQFEEMGDLLGMPAIKDGVTQFAPPAWVPVEDVPGILLIDDVNRADDRILRGIMQLLQNYELATWRLPPQWHIVLTANPDGGDYSVTPMDDAMITRMLHITLEFDVKAWALWAEKQGVDHRGIDFVLTYPEMVNGNRSTPRTLVQFFDNIQHIAQLQDELSLVQLLANACLDPVTSATFITYVQHNLGKMITIAEILQARDFDTEVVARLQESMKGSMRLDILSTLTTRLLHHVAATDRKLSAAELDNIKKFLKTDLMPNDIRMAAMQDILKIPALKPVLADPQLSKSLLLKM
ncbi:AAA family ATPase [Paraflavitalea sp. CAU 1676]|uniref:AAA family ATPase n=1 Tax=Paraflavitalea sp. CAU 1676 TaxID=3032598 RepID=UPI0023DB38CE|nr:AAA family ATPase [Paraflavitalea sp. CAU 1676]MDF2192090.1 AAA family ATPase [Paraflavitalea sp. CAU 1676]